MRVCLCVCVLTLETSVHVISERGKACWCGFERCPVVDNAALFQMKGHSVIVIIMTQGEAFSLSELFYLNVGLTLKKKKKKSRHLVKSPKSRVVITCINPSCSCVGLSCISGNECRKILF